MRENGVGDVWVNNAQQILRQKCDEVIPHHEALQSISGSSAAQALRVRMMEVAQESEVAVKTAISEFQAHRASALSSVEAFEREKNAAAAALKQLDLSNSLTLPHPVRHDRLLSLERLAALIRWNAERAVMTLEFSTTACAKEINDADLHQEVGLRAQYLKGLELSDWETWADEIGARSSTQSDRDASDSRKIIGGAIGLFIGALCVWIGWPLVIWSWNQTMDFGFGGIFGILILTGGGVWLASKENGIGYVLLFISACALIIILLGPTILFGGAYGGYYIANMSANYLGSREQDRSTEIADDHDSLMHSFVSKSEPTALGEHASVKEMRASNESLLALTTQLKNWASRSEAVAGTISKRRERYYFGESLIGFADEMDQAVWKEAGFPPPTGYALPDGLPIYREPVASLTNSMLK